MSINEGQTIQYTVVTSKVTDGTTLYWKTTGSVANADISGGNTGTITVTNNQATFNVSFLNDVATEGSETIGISLSTGSLSGPVVVSTANPITVNDTSLAPSYVLYTWGKNNQGQLGLGDVVPRSSPTQVGSGTTWNLVSTSRYSTMATKTDGTLWAWGANGYGQLGKNDIVYKSSPTQVGALTNWNLVSVGWYNVIATKTDGTLWTWGNNNSGQLGTNDRIYKSSPVQIGAASTWSQVCIGNFNAIAIGQ